MRYRLITENREKNLIIEGREETERMAKTLAVIYGTVYIWKMRKVIGKYGKYTEEPYKIFIAEGRQIRKEKWDGKRR